MRKTKNIKIIIIAAATLVSLGAYLYKKNLKNLEKDPLKELYGKWKVITRRSKAKKVRL